MADSRTRTTTLDNMARNFNKMRKGAAVETANYSAAGRIFHWVEPGVSGGVLVAGLVVLVSLLSYSSISILANLLLLGVMFGLGSKVYVHLMGMLKKECKDPLAQLALVDVTIPEETVTELVNSSAQTINNTSSELRRLLLGESMYDSVKFGLALYVLSILGAVFNTHTLAIISWVFAFILPKIYEDNQDSIDELIGKVQDQYSAVDAKVSAFFPAQASPPKVVEEVEIIGGVKEE